MEENTCCHLINSNSKNGLVEARQCSRKGIHIYNSKLYCGTHLNVVKSREECSICLCEMHTDKERIKLSCGHFFHLYCLEQCHSAECPLCRKPFVPHQAYKIFQNVFIKPFMDTIFSLPKNTQFSVIHSIKIIVGLGTAFPWCIKYLGQIIHLFNKFINNQELLERAFEAFVEELSTATS